MSWGCRPDIGMTAGRSSNSDPGTETWSRSTAPGDTNERLLPSAATGPTVAFAVDDLLAARAELVAAEIEIVADIVWAAEDVRRSEA